MHPKLACMLGFEKSKTLFDTPDCNTTISIPPLKEKNEKTYIFPHSPDLEHVLLPYVFLYYNIVTKTIIANTPFPLLKVIPVNFSKDIKKTEFSMNLNTLNTLTFNLVPCKLLNLKLDLMMVI